MAMEMVSKNKFMVKCYMEQTANEYKGYIIKLADLAN